MRDNLVRSHAASKSLIHVINDLLVSARSLTVSAVCCRGANRLTPQDLTRTEKGNDLFLTDPFDIAETLEEAVSTHRVEAKRRGLSLDVVETPTGTPPTVLGDRAKIRQIVTNVVANALKHTDEGGILIEWGEMIDENLRDALDAKQDGIRIGISVSDTGHGITEQKLENIFRQLENVSTVGDRERDASADTEQAVGLGLAVVARIVRNLGGQLQVESKVGKGSKFTFIFPFRLPPGESEAPRKPTAPIDGAQHAIQPAAARAPLGRRMSGRSAESEGSRGSKASSEIDSLIQVISGDHMSSPSPSARSHASRSIGSRSAGSAPSQRSFKTAASSQALSMERQDSGGTLPGQVEIRDSAIPLRASRMGDSSGSPASTPSLASALEGTAFFGNGSSAQKRLPQSLADRDDQSRRTSLSQVSAGESSTSGNATTPRPASPEQRGPVPAAADSSQSPDRPQPAKATAAEDAIDPLRVLVVEDEVSLSHPPIPL